MTGRRRLLALVAALAALALSVGGCRADDSGVIERPTTTTSY